MSSHEYPFADGANEDVAGVPVPRQQNDQDFGSGSFMSPTCVIDEPCDAIGFFPWITTTMHGSHSQAVPVLLL
jgi:hypothetical protein